MPSGKPRRRRPRKPRPKRVARSRKTRAITSTVKSLKGGTFIAKSNYEAHYSKILDEDPDVICFTYEPFKIPYRFRGANLNYIPDFQVVRVNYIEIVEVKPKRFMRQRKNQAKFRAARALYPRFRIITEAEIYGK